MGYGITMLAYALRRPPPPRIYKKSTASIYILFRSNDIALSKIPPHCVVRFIPPPPILFLVRSAPTHRYILRPPRFVGVLGTFCAHPHPLYYFSLPPESRHFQNPPGYLSKNKLTGGIFFCYSLPTPILLGATKYQC